MKPAILYQARQPLRIEELEMPEVGGDDVLIKVASCGVCHTDLKVAEGRNRFTPPTVLGHEVAGTVEQVGAHCKEFRVGDRIGRWPQLAIVEIKQPRHHHDTPAVRALRGLGIRETAVSKYCVGIATLGSVRANTFKPVVRELEHLSA